MIDLKLLANDFDTIANKLQKKGVDTALLEELKAKNFTLKEAKTAFETAQADQNTMSKLFGVYKKEGKDVAELKAKVDANKILLAELSEKQREADETLNTLVMGIPNIPDDTVPEGVSEDDNVEIKKVLDKGT